MSKNWTKGQIILKVGKEHCLHDGNRVAIVTTYASPDGEPGEETVAEVWDAPVDQDIADGKFIVEAFNVANETGLSPRELLADRQTLIHACRDFLAHAQDFTRHNRHYVGTLAKYVVAIEYALNDVQQMERVKQ